MLEETLVPQPRGGAGDSAANATMTHAVEEKEEPNMCAISLLSPAEEIQFLHARVRELEREKAAMESENQRLKDILVNEIPSLLSTMRQTLAAGGERIALPDFLVSDKDCMTTRSSSACSSPSLPAFSPTRESGNKQNLRSQGHITNCVELYPGSGVFCETMVWRAATQAHSATAMARTLLLGVFDMDTLLRSNLRGGKSKRANYSDQKEGLDPAKLDAIYNATMAKFPNARKGQIGVGINSKLSEIRFRCRKAKREKDYY
ncbi:uncharacterized protein LOC136718747 [Amia ocellicauda]|uniref:uncharacterized protein LOC136718747 n=1 Tax=Amia ocellicauda TaxID=2972642 RepID=UPI003463D9AD